MYSLCLLPVILFFVFLLLLDSFKLIKRKVILISGIWGLIAALLAMTINKSLMALNLLSFDQYARYLAPFIEEALKVCVFIYLIRKGNVGFMIDGAIYGFAAGAMFSVVENFMYFTDPQNTNPMIWIIRGFGTALMHGGTTSIILMFVMGSLNARKTLITALFKGILIAIVMHSLYNHLIFLISPFWVTIIILLTLPTIMIIVFFHNETALRKWLDVELSEEVKLLKMMQGGQLSHTKTGEYIISLKKNFSPEIILDMMNYIRLYTELSIQAKGIMMLKEAGFPISREEITVSKLRELKALKNLIGETGLIAISPILRMSQKDVWKLNLLEN